MLQWLIAIGALICAREKCLVFKAKSKGFLTEDSWSKYLLKFLYRSFDHKIVRHLSVEHPAFQLL